MSSNFYCIFGAIFAVYAAVRLFIGMRHSVLYIGIPTSVDPMDEGREGWKGLADIIRRERMMIAFKQIGIVAVGYVLAAGIVTSFQYYMAK